jgi:hypothetical protein
VVAAGAAFPIVEMHVRDGPGCIASHPSGATARHGQPYLCVPSSSPAAAAAGQLGSVPPLSSYFSLSDLPLPHSPPQWIVLCYRKP